MSWKYNKCDWEIHDYTPSVYNAYVNGEIGLLDVIQDVIATEQIATAEQKLSVIKEILTWQKDRTAADNVFDTLCDNCVDHGCCPISKDEQSIYTCPLLNKPEGKKHE